ncbi:ferritin-like domain-containing protein [Lysobacter humi (ex Lee et al. 2017)]
MQQPEITLGRNRTGIKTSPLDAAELAGMHDLQLTVGRPSISAEELRADYRREAEAVGSVPPPASLKGMVGATAQALAGHRMHILLDKLAERAAFERSGVRLYDALLLKASLADALPGDMSLDAVQAIRDDEAAHFALLAGSIERLGGDSTAMTPCADVTGVQGLGLLQAINDPRATLAQALQTVLAAELIDNASWELLIELGEGFGQDELVVEMRNALTNEQRHEALVRTWLSAELQRLALVRH